MADARFKSDPSDLNLTYALPLAFVVNNLLLQLPPPLNVLAPIFPPFGKSIRIPPLNTSLPNSPCAPSYRVIRDMEPPEVIQATIFKAYCEEGCTKKRYQVSGPGTRRNYWGEHPG